MHETEILKALSTYIPQIEQNTLTVILLSTELFLSIEKQEISGVLS